MGRDCSWSRQDGAGRGLEREAEAGASQLQGVCGSEISANTSLILNKSHSSQWIEMIVLTLSGIIDNLPK
jgi:hypothetical protein